MSLTAKNNNRRTSKKKIQAEATSGIDHQIPASGIQPPDKFAIMNEMLKKTKFLK